MKIARLCTETDNESHFEEVEVELKPIRAMAASMLQPAHGLMFHFAPTRHYLFIPLKQAIPLV